MKNIYFHIFIIIRGSQYTEKNIEAVKRAGDTIHAVSPSYFNLSAEGMIENPAIIDPLFIKTMHEDFH